MHVSFFDHCTVCKKGFETNFKHKITCSITCSKENKRVKKIETYRAGGVHRAKHHKREKPSAVSLFLSGKL